MHYLSPKLMYSHLRRAQIICSFVSTWKFYRYPSDVAPRYCFVRINQFRYCLRDTLSTPFRVQIYDTLHPA
jgi:hypothetical protein